MEAVGTARACGATGTIVVRMDCGCHGAAMIAAVRRAGARSSFTAPVNTSVRAGVGGILEGARKGGKIVQ
ncbi:MAG TPA: hypothetical protein VI365_22370 [Trebonia sp.]